LSNDVARSILRIGLVATQDVARGRVRVIFPDHYQLESWWLPIVVPKAQSDKYYWMPDLGEQVVCLMDQHDEDGAVLGAIYSSVDTVPIASPDRSHIAFNDGAFLDYNRSSHSLQVSLPSGGVINISANGASISIDEAGNVEIIAPGQIKLGGGSLRGVARLGDTVHVTDDEGGTLTGTIVSASTNVFAD
jgi:phage baseplate assembly protein V